MELRDYVRGLRRHWLAIVMMVLVGFGASFVWVQLQTPVYEAAADGIAKLDQSELDEQTLIQIGDPAAAAKVPSFLVIAGWRDVAQYVIEDLGLDTTPEELIERVAVSNPEGTTILRVVAQADSPTAARELAESWLRGMVDTIDQVDGNGSPGSAPVNIVAGDSASLPSEPIFPDLRTSLIVGGVIGLGFGVGFALMRTASDRRVRTADDVEKKTEVAVVGTLPFAKQSGAETRLFDPDAARGGPGFAVAEALRTLRTNLQFMDVDNPPRTIVITSPLPGDGKSTVACNLALTLAANGSHVVLVDGDLRRSKVAETMGVSSSAGLSDVLAGRAEVVDVLQRAPQSKNLFVLAAGSPPPNPSEVLGSARMKHLLDDLAEHSTVIIDAPPLIPVTDGAVLSHQADGALVVVSLGKTTFDLVEKALDTLRKARGRALGIVLNKVPLRGADASPYSYEYQRHYSAGHAKRGAPAAAAEAVPSAADEPLSSSGGRPVDHTRPTFLAAASLDAAASDEAGAMDDVGGLDAEAAEVRPTAQPSPRNSGAAPASASAPAEGGGVFDELLAPDHDGSAHGEQTGAPRRHRARRG